MAEISNTKRASPVEVREVFVAPDYKYQHASAEVPDVLWPEISGTKYALSVARNLTDAFLRIFE